MLAVIEGLGAKLGLLNWSCVHYDTRRILTYTDSRLVVAIKCKFVLLYNYVYAVLNTQQHYFLDDHNGKSYLHAWRKPILVKA